MQWISVKDKLPSHLEKVIFYVEERNEYYCGFFQKFLENGRIGSPKAENIFFENLDNWWFEGENITHWMPLPEPPKPDQPIQD